MKIYISTDSDDIASLIEYAVNLAILYYSNIYLESYRYKP